ncbi:hypothetical protein [Reichenbachiella ulvae]|uniref:Uncharacterized protein n=1 Tax=Reichenbachiella ulvae TaxID=2980104 RepID=A0ABT3CPY1_9BACT|nr:hypothetical protein [Reichenbachiella ulvae]MCV9385775.1 hypothetical protein [Reichenbachiella ulvae]
MEIIANQEIERTAIQNIVNWVEEIDRHEEMLPLGNSDEMLALLENTKGAPLNAQELLVAHHMLINSVVN